jgi:hypothetical protein
MATSRVFSLAVHRANAPLTLVLRYKLLNVPHIETHRAAFTQPNARHFSVGYQAADSDFGDAQEPGDFGNINQRQSHHRMCPIPAG